MSSYKFEFQAKQGRGYKVPWYCRYNLVNDKIIKATFLNFDKYGRILIDLYLMLLLVRLHFQEQMLTQIL